MTQEDLPGKITEVESGLSKAQEGMQTITAQEKKLAASKKQLKSGKKKIAAGKAKLLDAKDKLEKGQISVEEAKNEISKQKVLVAIKLSVAEVQVNTDILLAFYFFTDFDKIRSFIVCNITSRHIKVFCF